MTNVSRVGSTGLHDELVRARLVAGLDVRWSTSVTVIEAPGGYGKSTALAQAIAHNLADPVGVDVPIVCRPFHSDAVVLTSAILGALSARVDLLPSEPDDLANVVLRAISGESPTTVCLILDDLHHLRAEESAAAMLRSLIHGMPTNLRLVLAGRTIPRLPLTRLIAADDLRRFGVADLRFDVHEVDALAARHGVDPGPLRSAEGWPAVTRLAITAGAVAPVDFLVEEIAGSLSADDARAVAATIIGSGQPLEWLRELCGVTHLDAVVERIPLVRRRDDGCVIAHDLWSDAIDSLVDADTKRTFAEAVARRAITESLFDEAVETATRHGAWTAALEAVLGFVMGGESFPSVPRIRALRDRFPASMDEQPELLLLDAMIARVSNAADGGAAAANRALASFQERGSAREIAAAAFEVGYGAWLRGDLTRVLDMYEIAKTLTAQGHRFLVPMMTLVEAITADLRGDAHQAAALLESVDLSLFPTPLTIYVLRELLSKLQLIGETRHAVEQAEHLRRVTNDPRVDFTIALAKWLDGDPTVVVAEWSQLRHRHIDHNHTDFLTWVYSAVIDASLGLDGDDAAVDYAVERSREQAFRAIAQAATAVAAGDEARARGSFDALGAAVGFDDPLCAGELRRQLTIGYLLHPAIRELIDGSPLGPSQVRRRDVTRLLLAVREGQPVDWEQLRSAEELLTTFPLVWTAELLAAAARDGVITAGELSDRVDVLSEGRLQHQLHRLAERADSLGRAAARLADDLGAARERLRIDVFGPMVITHEQRSLDATLDVRPATRGRVRQLLGALVLRERVSVDALLGALWPTMSPQQARNNLAVSMRMLRDLLDGPGADDRAGGLASSLLVRESNSLRLRSTASLSCDLWDVRRSLQAASMRERSGDVVGAMHAVEAAFSNWRGQLLADLDDVDPFNAEIVAVMHELTARSCELAEWHLAGGRFARAEEIGERVLEHDPYEERAHAAVLRALLEHGSSARLASAIVRCRQALDELEVAPGAALAMILRRAEA